MKGIIKIAAVAMLPLLAGCADPSGLKSLPNSGSAFHQGLQANYAQLAQMEYDERDWTDTDFFTERAKAAAAGQDFGPQNPADRKLPADMVGKAKALHTDLVAALGSGRQAAPVPAARAQAMYDCWLQELEENIQPADIAWCMGNFEPAFAELKRAIAPKPAAAAPAAAPAATPAAMPGPFLVYFDWDRSSIDSEDRNAIQQALASARQAGSARFVIEGHTDLSGPDAHNDRLSQRRAEAVAGELRKSGVSESQLRVTGFGETTPAVKTADGVREPQNRRAVIKIER